MWIWAFEPGLIYKALKGKAPSYFSRLLSHRKFSRSLRKEPLTVPLAKLKIYGDQAFSSSALRLWNNLPLGIRNSPPTASWKKKLKACLIIEVWLLSLFLVQAFAFLFSVRLSLELSVLLNFKLLTFISCPKLCF